MPVTTSTPTVVKVEQQKVADDFQTEQIVILTPRGGANVVKFVVDAGKKRTVTRTVTPDEGEPHEEEYEVVDPVEKLGHGVAGADLLTLMDAAGLEYEALKAAGATPAQAFYGAIKQASYVCLQGASVVPSGSGVTVS